METDRKSHLGAATVLGCSVLIAVCLGGCFLLANTLLLANLAGASLRPGWLSPRPRCEFQEEVLLPFSRGDRGVATRHSYAGTVLVTVSGEGQSAGEAFSDAFYLFADDHGLPIPVEHPDEWVLSINSKLAHELMPRPQVPAYNDRHHYAFEIHAPGGPLTFGILDGYSADNTGSLSISLCQR
mgnify:CR=1 FL=1